MLTRTKLRMRGVSLTETLVMMPVFLMLTLGIIQFALIYEAKSSLDYATFMGARAGALDHAKQGAISEGLAKSLSPLFSPDLHNQAALQATIAKARAEIAAYSDIKIINPTTEAFDDFGVNENGQQAIPNGMLHVRDPKPGDRSRVNIQDANLLKVQVLYGHRLQVPFVNRIISTVTSWFTTDPVKLAYLHQQRLPILATATVRMQSTPWKNDWMMRLADVNKAIEDANQTGEALNLATLPRPWGGPTGERDRGSSSQSGGHGGSAANDDPGTAPEGSTSGDQTSADGTGQGSPSPCGSRQTTSRPTSVQAASGGNPIHIVTGNKYQHEVDLSPLPGALSLEFSRHYNSQSSYHSVMGYGWSHTYDVQLSVRPAGDIKLRQGDGRTLYFTKTLNNKYETQQASDGYLNKLENGFDWVWSNGKILQFSNQGQLTRISNSQGEVLNLIYIDNQLHKVTDKNQRTLVLGYTSKGHLKQLIDPAGKQIHYHYDQNNNLISTKNAAGYTRQYHYDDEHDPHNLTGLTDERGVRFASWAYDDQDRAILSSHADNVEKITLKYLPDQTTVTNSKGISTVFYTAYKNGIPIVAQVDGPGCSTCGESDTSYEYNDRIQLTKVTHRNGISKRYIYDDQSRLIQISEHHADSARVIAKYGYEANNKQPSLITEPSINPNAMHQWWLFYTDSNQIERVTEVGYTPDGENNYQEMTRTTHYGYMNNRLAYVDGPVPGNSDKVIYHYNKTGELSGIETPEGKIIPKPLETLDDYGRPNQIHHADGSVATLKYNAQNLLASVSFANNNSSRKDIRLDYDPTGNLRSLTGPKGEASVKYDKSGRPIMLIAPDGQQIQWSWDTENQLIDKKRYHQDGQLKIHQHFERDQTGQLLSVLTGANKYTYRYDQKGRLNSLIDPLNHENRYAYDDWNRITAITKAAGSDSPASENIEYDVHNRPITLTDARGNSSHTAYDDFGNKLYRYTPDGGVKVYRYNARGQVIASVDESALITRFDYDQTGRLAGIGAFDMPPTTKFDQANNKSASQDSLYQKTQYIYDKDGKIMRRDITLKDLDKVFSTYYDYNDDGQIQYKTLPDGQRLTFKYSTDGDLEAIEKENLLWNKPVIDQLKFTPAGLISAFIHNNEHKVENNYDDQGRLASQHSTVQGNKNYGYDILGKLTQITHGKENYLYKYDSQDRLIQASEGNTQYQWQYDMAGNRVRSDENSELSLYQYAKDSNRLIEHNGKPVKYRSTGQPISKGLLRYEYTLGGRPAKVYRNDILVAEYRYNSEGERIRKIDHTQSPAKTTYYLYENKQLTAEINEQGKVIRQYLYLGQRPIATLDNNTIYAIHTDHRHAPVAVTDQDGNIKWRAQYTPFGKAKIQANKISMNLRLPGQYFDAETNTHYNIYRDYDPSTGRYLTSDPLGNRAGLNTYTYVKNDPMNRVDPLGLFDEVVHYNMTYFLGVVAGLDDDTARMIASASQYVDDNPDTRPLDGNSKPNLRALPLYHFTAEYDRNNRGDVSGNARSRFILMDINGNPLNWSKQLRNLYNAAMEYNFDGCLRGGGDPRRVKNALFGEFLHTYQDQFSHRDALNRPIDRPVLGHGPEGKRPDYTFNQWDDNLENEDPFYGGNHCGGPKLPLIGKCDPGIWRYNELRTLEMEKETFILLRKNFKEEITKNRNDRGLSVLTKEDYDRETQTLWTLMAGDGNSRIGRPDKDDPFAAEAKGKTGILQEFNMMESFIDSVDSNNKETSSRFPDKINMLNKWIVENEFSNKFMIEYNENDAEYQRDRYIDTLDKASHPGVLIPTVEENIIAP